MFYVYVYIDPITLQPFYVGKGSGNRAWDHIKFAERDNSHEKYNKHKNNKIKQILNQDNTPLVVKLLETPDETLAYLEEERVISILGRKDLGTGPLTNQSNGGRGGQSRTVSEETRLKMSEHRKGKTTITQEGRAILSQRWLGTSRPKTDAHIASHKRSIQKHTYVTPYGSFVSSNEAAKADTVSNVTIHKRCLQCDVPIKASRNLPTELVGKTWREVGYYTE